MVYSISDLANSADTDEMQHNPAFHLGLHCLQKYLFRGFHHTKGYKASGKLNISLCLTFLPHGPLYVLYGFVELVYSNPCRTRAAVSRRSHRIQEKCRTPRCVQYDRKHHRSKAVASPVDAV